MMDKNIDIINELDFEPYVRIPFEIAAVEVTEENFDKIAELIGNRVDVDERDQRYIFVDKRIVPNSYRVYVGWYVTRFGDHWRCYSPKAFPGQFAASGTEWLTAVQEIVDVQRAKDISLNGN